MGGEPRATSDDTGADERPSFALDPDVLAGIVSEALSDPDARKRREAVLESDPRAPSEVVAAFGEIDQLVEALCARMLLLEEQASLPPPPAEEIAEEIGEEDVIEIETAFGGEMSGRMAAAAQEVPRQHQVTREIPAVPTADRPPPMRVDEERRAASLLYEDVLWLLSVNDGEGALISLERLLVMVEPSGEVKEFIELNEAKLLNLYEGYIGPFDKVPKPLAVKDGAGMPGSYLEEPKIKNLLGMVDGKLSIADLIRDAPYSPLETCCVLNQLRRSALVEL